MATAQTSYDWYEVWAEWLPAVPKPPHFMILFGNDHSDQLWVFDPQEDEVLLKTTSYDAARNWLCEDEFSLVTGRVQLGK
jgi:hypothetical protein